MRKPKKYIAVWKGLGFYHDSYKIGDFTFESDTPLGCNAERIKKLRDEKKCAILFLNEDFSEDYRI